MNNIKKAIFFALILVIALPVVSFGADKGKIVIGATPFPHAVILEQVKKIVAKEGYTLEIKEFTDYVTPNLALADKSLNANFFQHIPYLENMNKEKKLDLVWVAKVHIEPLGLYSKKIKKLSDIKKGDTIAVPNDPTNGARALRLLEKHKLISVKPGDLVTARDITKNPLSLKIVELDAAQLPRTLDDTAASVINTNFAFEAGLVPSKDAIVLEGKDSPYANVLVVRKADKDLPSTKALIKAINSPAIKAFIKKELEPKGIVAAF